MDDFRLGPVSSSDPYGRRGPNEPIRRKPEKRHDDQNGEQKDQAADEFQPSGVDDRPAESSEPVEDYYLPGETSEEPE